jgi:hypothetical protein
MTGLTGISAFTLNGMAGLRPRQGGGTPRSKRPSGLLKAATNTSSGSSYDRDPCPHAVVRWDWIADLTDPDNLSRRRLRRTEHRCERPGAHVRESRPMSAPDPAHPEDPHRFVTIIVPDEAARLHADASGNTWK